MTGIFHPRRERGRRGEEGKERLRFPLFAMLWEEEIERKKMNECMKRERERERERERGSEIPSVLKAEKLAPFERKT